MPCVTAIYSSPCIVIASFLPYIVVGLCSPCFATGCSLHCCWSLCIVGCYSLCVVGWYLLCIVIGHYSPWLLLFVVHLHCYYLVFTHVVIVCLVLPCVVIPHLGCYYFLWFLHYAKT